MKAIASTAIGALVFLSGCNDMGTNTDVSGVTGRLFDSTVNGTTLACPVGVTFSLALDLSADAGYQWFYTMSNPSVVELVSTDYRPKNGGGGVGGLTVETFYFQGAKPGTCTVVLDQRRGWETGVPPIVSISFQVSVHR